MNSGARPGAGPGAAPPGLSQQFNPMKPTFGFHKLDRNSSFLRNETDQELGGHEGAFDVSLHVLCSRGR